MLFTLSFSPTHCDLPALLRLANEGDAVLLLQDGVLAGLIDSPSLDLLLKAPLTLYALQDDLEARGVIDYISLSVNIVGYHHFVVLTEQHRSQMAW